MNWRLKVAGFKALSSLPGGTALYRFTQKNITGSLRPTHARISQKITVGLTYLDWLEQNGCKERLLRGSHLDFGAGWHPTIPLLFYSYGVDRQYLFDVSHLLDQELVDQTVEIFLSIVEDPKWPHRSRLRRLPTLVRNRDWREYLDRLGIEYRAPYGSAWPALKNGVGVASSTQVLLHIPKPVLAECFTKIHSILEPGGVFLATVHLRDLVSGGPKYNQLRYSKATWERWVNSPLMSYNRLRAPDYSEVLRQAGFTLPGFTIEPGNQEDMVEFDRTPIAPCFSAYSRDDLAAKHLFFAAQKP